LRNGVLAHIHTGMTEHRTDQTGDDALRALEPQYSHVMRIGLALFWVPLAIGACAVDALVLRRIGAPWGLLSVVAVLVAISAIMVLPSRKYARWGYAMMEDRLRIARGYLFHVDTIVPFVRVQHIDVGQGPVERAFGLSHLVVHTAGTHNSTVTLPGLTSADAAAMRDTIRRQIQTDFA
jgi:membrane protein YdbS with pleckstrin-like domain